MALSNDFVKKYLFDNLEKLLSVETCGGDQAQVIAEVHVLLAGSWYPKHSHITNIELDLCKGH